MDTPPSASAGSSSRSSEEGQHNSSSHSFHSGSNGKNKDKQKLVDIGIQPTIGPSFALSLPANTKIADLKETISDKMGLSPQKMTLLHHNNALVGGTLLDNKIEAGTELRLVPAIESGVTTTKVNSVDPVAMMKHSMSGISDQQIDDFLNGKFPLSVAIRVGESVVVVNLHRAKVEEIEMEPPPTKRRCMRARRPSSRDEMDYVDPFSPSTSSSSPSSSSLYTAKHHHLHHRHLLHHSNSPSSRDTFRCLNSNHSGASADYHHHHHHHHHHHRRSHSCSHPLDTSSSSSSKTHRGLAKGQDASGSRRHLHPHHHHIRRTHPPSPPSSLAQVTDRSMLTCTHDLAGAPMETAVAVAAPPAIETPIPHITPIISKDAPVVTATISPQPRRILTRVIKDARHPKGLESARISQLSAEESMEIATTVAKSESISESTEHSISLPTDSPDSPPNLGSGSNTAPSGSSKSISRSVQTDPEVTEKDSNQSTPDSRIELYSPSRDRKLAVSSRRDAKLPENGVSMKRKAVMEAISEILKKMYANTEKGRLPGSFKGRFSSEFTCDSDMREILHSKTTMTSYGSDGDDLDIGGSCDGDVGGAFGGGSRGSGDLSQAKLEENQSLKDKVASLKWKLQHKRAMKIAKRNGVKSPCGWMEMLSCNFPGAEPKPIERTGYCGMKRGFLLDPSF